MSVSILVPIYNVEKYIEKCLHSVMAQTYQGEIECIIVDDCGTDNSIAIAKRLIDGYNGPIEFRIIHHEHNRGLAAARNTAVAAAKGKFIIRDANGACRYTREVRGGSHFSLLFCGSVFFGDYHQDFDFFSNLVLILILF